MNRTFLGLADMAAPPKGYEEYIWSCDGCVKGIKWRIHHDIKYRVLEDPWKDEGKVDKAVRYLESIRSNMIKDLSEELNDT